MNKSNKTINKENEIKTINFLSWNVRGFNYSKRNNLKILESETNCNIICLQETNLRNKNTKVQGFTAYNKVLKKKKQRGGGLTILVKQNIRSNKKTLKTSFEANAIEIGIPINCTICNVYQEQNKQHKKSSYDQTVG